jgi:hypothetical protein
VQPSDFFKKTIKGLKMASGISSATGGTVIKQAKNSSSNVVNNNAKASVQKLQRQTEERFNERVPSAQFPQRFSETGLPPGERQNGAKQDKTPGALMASTSQNRRPQSGNSTGSQTKPKQLEYFQETKDEKFDREYKNPAGKALIEGGVYSVGAAAVIGPALVDKVMPRGLGRGVVMGIGGGLAGLATSAVTAHMGTGASKQTPKQIRNEMIRGTVGGAATGFVLGLNPFKNSPHFTALAALGASSASTAALSLLDKNKSVL